MAEDSLHTSHLNASRETRSPAPTGPHGTGLWHPGELGAQVRQTLRGGNGQDAQRNGEGVVERSIAFVFSFPRTKVKVNQVRSRTAQVLRQGSVGRC